MQRIHRRCFAGGWNRAVSRPCKRSHLCGRVAAAAPSTTVMTLAGDLPIRECIGDILNALEVSTCMVLQVCTLQSSPLFGGPMESWTLLDMA